MKYGVWFAMFAAGLIMAQNTKQTSNGKQNDQKKEENKQAAPAPLFSGKIGLKSSSNTKESATLGFNGIDPSGKVGAQILATSASSSDRQKIDQLAKAQPNAAERADFIRQGGLKTK